MRASHLLYLARRDAIYLHHTYGMRSTYSQSHGYKTIPRCYAVSREESRHSNFGF